MCIILSEDCIYHTLLIDKSCMCLYMYSSNTEMHILTSSISYIRMGQEYDRSCKKGRRIIDSKHECSQDFLLLETSESYFTTSALPPASIK